MPSRRTFAGLLCLTIFSRSVLPALADDPSWPQFRGPNRDGISTETGLLEQWPEGGPKRLWTTRGIGHGFASLAIVDGLIYTAGNLGDQTVVTAMDLSGKIRWQTPNGKAWKDPVPGARGMPTIDGDRLYHESPHGEVICLDAKTGQKIWGLNILEEFHAKNITWAVSESLLIDGDRVICSPGGPETALVALDKQTGKTVWQSPSTGDLAGYCSGVLVECDGLRLVMTLTAKAFIGVNAESGDLLWRVEHITPFDENISSPLYHDGRVFISTRTTGSVMFEIHVDGNKASVESVWRTKELDNQHGGVVLVDGHLYGACLISNHGNWSCIDWKTGQMTYTEKGVGRGSLTYADGMLYTLSERAIMGLVRAAPQQHEVISQFRLPPGGEGPSWAHPVVHGGRLYIRYSDLLHAYDVKNSTQ